MRPQEFLKIEKALIDALPPELVKKLNLCEGGYLKIDEVEDGFLFTPADSRLPSVGGSMRKDECREKFSALAETWISERGPHSLVRDLVDHPAYREVIAMGTDAVPFILERLDTHLEDWFPALTAIVGIDPVPPQSAGKLEEMPHAWKQWGRENGYYPAVF